MSDLYWAIKRAAEAAREGGEGVTVSWKPSRPDIVVWREGFTPKPRAPVNVRIREGSTRAIPRGTDEPASKEGDPMSFSQKLKTLLRSRRFLIAAGAVVAIAAHDLLGLDEAQVNQLVAVCVTWIAADAWRRTGNP